MLYMRLLAKFNFKLLDLVSMYYVSYSDCAGWESQLKIYWFIHNILYKYMSVIFNS